MELSEECMDILADKIANKVVTVYMNRVISDRDIQLRMNERDKAEDFITHGIDSIKKMNKRGPMKFANSSKLPGLLITSLFSDKTMKHNVVIVED